MNKVKIMKRDILIIPKFKNVNLIQKIRLKYDTLAKLVPPHITLVFPFADNISDNKLVSLVKSKVQNLVPFYVNFKGILMNYDTYTQSNYIYLNCIEGSENIQNLHDILYSTFPLSKHLNSNIKYIPHITLGHTDNINIKLYDNFESIIDEIVIEKIGEHDESIIIDKIKLGE